MDYPVLGHYDSIESTGHGSGAQEQELICEYLVLACSPASAECARSSFVHARRSFALEH